MRSRTCGAHPPTAPVQQASEPGARGRWWCQGIASWAPGLHRDQFIVINSDVLPPGFWSDRADLRLRPPRQRAPSGSRPIPIPEPAAPGCYRRRRGAIGDNPCRPPVQRTRCAGWHTGTVWQGVRPQPYRNHRLPDVADELLRRRAGKLVAAPVGRPDLPLTGHASNIRSRSSVVKPLARLSAHSLNSCPMIL